MKFRALLELAVAISLLTSGILGIKQQFRVRRARKQQVIQAGLEGQTHVASDVDGAGVLGGDPGGVTELEADAAAVELLVADARSAGRVLAWFYLALALIAGILGAVALAGATPGPVGASIAAGPICLVLLVSTLWAARIDQRNCALSLRDRRLLRYSGPIRYRARTNRSQTFLEVRGPDRKKPFKISDKYIVENVAASEADPKKWQATSGSIEWLTPAGTLVAIHSNGPLSFDRRGTTAARPTADMSQAGGANGLLINRWWAITVPLAAAAALLATTAGIAGLIHPYSPTSTVTTSQPTSVTVDPSGAPAQSRVLDGPAQAFCSVLSTAQVQSQAATTATDLDSSRSSFESAVALGQGTDVPDIADFIRTASTSVDDSTYLDELNTGEQLCG